MISKDKLIKVKNINKKGTVGYTIPEMNNLHRNFTPNEIKEISMEELTRLSYIPGGEFLLKNCLTIQDEEAVRQLLGNVEPEYFYTEEDIKRILISGSLNEFLDMLDFAPDHILDMVKTLSVELELNDVKKREAILEKMSFDVTKAIENNKALSEEQPEEEARAFRRLNEKKVEPAYEKPEARRTAPPKYKVIKKDI